METVMKIMLATLSGTALMTAFSYVVSAKFKEMWQEPRLLNLLLRYCNVDLSIRILAAMAWMIHYFIGLIFVICYEIIWQLWLPFSWYSGIIFGAISGMLGILGWIILFSLPYKKPKIDFKGYFIQLFFAHIFFAIGVVTTYHVIYYYC